MNHAPTPSAGARHLVATALLLALLLGGCGSGADTTDTAGPRSRPKGSKRAAEAPARAAGELDPSTVRLRRLGTWDSPLQVVGVPGTDRIAVVEQGGRILLEDPAASDGGSGRVLLDLSDAISTGGERGLLGLAFHERWPRDSRIFVDYTDRGGDTRVVEYRLASARAVASHPRELLHVEQPYENHNGGALAMADGLLYVGMGDGGSGGDPEDRAQDPDELLGKVLRIDVDAAGGAGDPEVWAIGLRNPWRFSIDPATGLLWIGDVGQDTREEIDAIPTSGDGVNLGWDVREGTIAHADAGPKGPGSLVEPIFDYGRDDGCSVTGGIVYRGRGVPTLTGRYVFADLCSDRLWALDAAAVSTAGEVTGDLQPARLAGVGESVSFGLDDSGELYLASISGGVYAFEAVKR